MPDLKFLIPGFVQIDDETIRLIESYLTVASLTGRKYDATFNVPGAAGATAVVLWSTSIAAFTTFTWGILILDPSRKRAANDHQDLDIRTTINGSTHIQRRDKNSPMIFGASAQGSGAITQIEALNLAGTTATTDDVEARLLLLV